MSEIFVCVIRLQLTLNLTGPFVFNQPYKQFRFLLILSTALAEICWENFSQKQKLPSPQTVTGANKRLLTIPINFTLYIAQIFSSSFLFLQLGSVSRWRVCYQRG